MTRRHRQGWALLPDALLQEISKRAYSINDVAQARLVCQGWRAGFATTVQLATVYATASPQKLAALHAPKFAMFKDINTLTIRPCSALGSEHCPQAAFDAVVTAASAAHVIDLTVEPVLQHDSASSAPNICSLASLGQLQHLRRLALLRGCWSGSQMADLAALPGLQRLSLRSCKLSELRHLPVATQLTHLEVWELDTGEDCSLHSGPDSHTDERVSNLLQPLSALQRLQHLGVTAAAASVPPGFAAAMAAVLPELATVEFAVDCEFSSLLERLAAGGSSPPLLLIKVRWCRIGGAMLPVACSGVVTTHETRQPQPAEVALAACLPMQPLHAISSLELRLIEEESYEGDFPPSVQLTVMPTLRESLRHLTVDMGYGPGCPPNAMVVGLPLLESLVAPDFHWREGWWRILPPGLTRLELRLPPAPGNVRVNASCWTDLDALQHLTLHTAYEGVAVGLSGLPTSLVTLRLCACNSLPDQALQLPALTKLELLDPQVHSLAAFAACPALRVLRVLGSCFKLQPASFPASWTRLSELSVPAEVLYDLPARQWCYVQVGNRLPVGAKPLAPIMARNVQRLAAQLPLLRFFKLTGVPPGATCLGPAIAALSPLQHLRQLHIESKRWPGDRHYGAPLSRDSYSSVGVLTQLVDVQLPYLPSVDVLTSALAPLTALKRLQLVQQQGEAARVRHTRQRDPDDAIRVLNALMRLLPTTCITIVAEDQLLC